MKKCLFVLLSIIMLLTVIPVGSISSYAATRGDSNSATAVEYEYKVLEDGTAEITGYTGTATNLTIPSTLDGYSVISMGWGAFRDCRNLTSITIPESVTSIGGEAFYGCTSLTSVTIPGSVTSIGANAFSICESLTSITIPDSVTILGDWAFSACTSLTSVTISDGVTSIGRYVFFGCTNLSSVTIPDGVTSIGERAFSACTSLSSITIPDSVTTIDSGAFMDCTSLTDVYYGGSESGWNEISFIGNNDDLLNANIHFLGIENVDVGIMVSGEDADTLPANTQLIVEEIYSTDGKIKYDITLQSKGVEVQPNGNVTVKIPVPQNMEGNNCKVYRLEEDGSKTDMNAVYENGYMVFMTEHFSVYTLEEKTFIYGDLNGDNIINKKDSLLLKMYLADDTTNINQLAADVYADGIINKKDSLYLKQYLAGLDIELGK